VDLWGAFHSQIVTAIKGALTFSLLKQTTEDFCSYAEFCLSGYKVFPSALSIFLPSSFFKGMYLEPSQAGGSGEADRKGAERN
jgi:hypothetical protein